MHSFGTEVNKPMKLYSNSKTVFNSLATEDSLYKKKYTVIVFHKLQEATVVGIIRPYHVSSEENKSNFLTKATRRDKYNKATNQILN